MTPVAALAACILLTAPPAAGRTDALVDRIVEAYGGKAALESHPVVVQEGEVSAHRSADVGRVTRILERPWRLRVTIRYPGSKPERRILDGLRGWRDGQEVTGSPPHLAMVLQAARMDLPFALQAVRDRLIDGGTVLRGDRKLRVLTIPLDDRLLVSAEVDPETGRIVRAVGRADIGQGRLEFVTEYADFRKVSGVLVPFREENYAQGNHTGTTVLKSVEFLPEAPTGAFGP